MLKMLFNIIFFLKRKWKSFERKSHDNNFHIIVEKFKIVSHELNILQAFLKLFFQHKKFHDSLTPHNRSNPFLISWSKQSTINYHNTRCFNCMVLKIFMVKVSVATFLPRFMSSLATTSGMNKVCEHFMLERIKTESTISLFLLCWLLMTKPCRTENFPNFMLKFIFASPKKTNIRVFISSRWQSKNYKMKQTFILFIFNVDLHG